MKKRIAFLIGLACACLISTTQKSRAQVQSTLSGDSAQYRYWCGDSTGSPRACDSAWWYLTRINPATGAEVFVDSGRTTSPTAVFGGAWPRYRISDAQFTSLTSGRYVLDIVAWGGTFGSQKLTTPVSHYFSVGLDSSVILATSINDAAYTPPKFHTGFYNRVADSVDNHYMQTNPNDTIRFVRRTDTLAFILPAEKSLLADTIDNHPMTTTAADKQGIRDTVLSTWMDEDNLLRNPHFENGSGDLPVIGWKERIGGNNIKVSTALPSSGRKALRFSGTTNGVDSDSLYLLANSNIVLSGRVFASATNNAHIGLYPVGGAIATAKAAPQRTDAYHTVSTSARLTSSGFYTVLLAGGSGASDTVWWDDVSLKMFPDTLDTAAIARAPWDNDLIAQTGRIVDSAAGVGIRNPASIGATTYNRIADSVDNHYMQTNPNDTIRFVRRTDTLAFILPAEKSLLADTIDNHPMSLTPAERSVLTDSIVHYLFSGSILRNPSFEYDPTTASPTGWNQGGSGSATITTGGSAAVGRHAYKVSGTAAQTLLSVSDTMILAPNRKYYLGAWLLKTGTTSPGIGLFNGASQIGSNLTAPPTAGLWYWSDTVFNIAAAGKYIIKINTTIATTNDSAKVDGIAFLPMDSANINVAAGSTDTAAIGKMMDDRRFLRHRSSPGNPNDTANAVVTATVSAGAYLCSLLVVDSTTNLPVQGVDVWVTTSGALTTDDIPTNSAGNVVFNLDNGTHAAHIFKSLTRLATNADTVIDIAGANFKDTIVVVSPNIPSAPVAGQITVAGNLYDISADEAEGAVVTFYLNEMCFYSSDDTTNMVAVAGEKTVTVDSTGYWQVNIYPTTKLVSSDRRNPAKYAITIQWPNGQTKCTEYEWTFDTTCCQALQWQLHRWKANCSR